MRRVARAGLIAAATIAVTVAGTGVASADPPANPGHCGELVAEANQFAPGFGGFLVTLFAKSQAVSGAASSQCEGLP